MSDDKLEPIEQLRYFCSNHLPAEAWLDSEDYFEAVVAEIKQLKKELSECIEMYDDGQINYHADDLADDVRDLLTNNKE